MSGIVQIKIRGNLRQNVVGLSPQQFTQAMKRNLDKANRMIMDGYLGFIGTWQHHDPKLDKKTSYDINKLFTQVTSDDDILAYLDFGTSKRYAVMAKGFVAKTSVRTIRSGRGGGSPFPVRRGKNAPQMDGIEARQVSLAIAEKLVKDMNADNRKAISGIIKATITGGTRK